MAKIAFTYDVGTATGQVRLYAGDTDGAGLNRTGGDRTRTDAEIGFLLAQNSGNVRGAAAELLEAKAAEYAQAALKSDQGRLKQDATERGRQCAEAAARLRANVGRPLATVGSAAVFTSETMKKW